MAKKSNIAVIQVTTPNIKEYSDLTIPTVTAYCLKHGYTHLVYNKGDDYFPHPAWAKIDILVTTNLTSYDYVWVLDADCVINNDKKSLEDLIDFDTLHDAWCSVNGANGGRLFNTGSIIYDVLSLGTLGISYRDYCNSKSKEELKRPFWEQDFINDITSHFAICELPMDTINSHWIDFGKDNLIHHFMGRGTATKVQVIQDYLRNKENHVYK